MAVCHSFVFAYNLDYFLAKKAPAQDKRPETMPNTPARIAVTVPWNSLPETKPPMFQFFAPVLLLTKTGSNKIKTPPAMMTKEQSATTKNLLFFFLRKLGQAKKQAAKAPTKTSK